MTQSVKAVIHWIDANQGGRLAPPAGARYSTIVHFMEDTTDWPDRVWSIVADLEPAGESANESRARLRFLSPEGPSQHLHAGSRFELYEGARIVARGEVLEDAEQHASEPASQTVIKEPPGSFSMSTPESQPGPTAEALRAELAEKEDQLRRLLRLYDQISRTEFRDRAQRLKAMRTQREDLEKEIAALKQHLATHE